MQFTKDFSEYRPWSGAVDTYDKIKDAGKLDELEVFLESYFWQDTLPTECQINDLLWFEDEWVLDCLGLSEKVIPDLPTEVDCTLDDLCIDIDEEDVDRAINECGCDYLSDEYGYCVNAANFTRELDRVHFYNIEWDTED